MALLNQVGESVRGGNPANALEKYGLDDMALVREIRKRLFVQYQPVLVEADHEEPNEPRYAFVKIVPESATARGDAWKLEKAVCPREKGVRVEQDGEEGEEGE